VIAKNHLLRSRLFFDFLIPFLLKFREAFLFYFLFLLPAALLGVRVIDRLKT